MRKNCKISFKLLFLKSQRDNVENESTREKKLEEDLFKRGGGWVNRSLPKMAKKCEGFSSVTMKHLDSPIESAGLFIILNICLNISCMVIVLYSVILFIFSGWKSIQTCTMQWKQENNRTGRRQYFVFDYITKLIIVVYRLNKSLI